MSPGRLEADVDQYRQAAAANTPPPALTPDPLVGGLSPIEQLLRVLGMAANLGDEQDNIDGADEHAERDTLTADAAGEFAAQDEDAATQLAQQVPQMASGMVGSLAGALAAAMQPFAQIPQQLAQGAQQALQAGLGMVQQAGGSAELADLGLGEDAAVADLSPEAVDLGDPAGFGDGAGPGADGAFGDAGGAGPAGGFSGGGGSSPGPALAPAVPPSAGTFPSSVRAPAPVPAAPPAHAAAPSGGMAGVPMVPPAAMNAAAPGDREARTDTKRVSVPPVRNGAPVQGRLTAPPVPAEAAVAPVRTVQGKPIATRRVITTRDDDPEAGNPAGRG